MWNFDILLDLYKRRIALKLLKIKKIQTINVISKAVVY